MAKRILVTGCAGFIGANVCRQLLDEGCLVSGVDSLNDAYDPRLKEWRLGRLATWEGFRFHQGDISELAAARSLFEADAKSGESVEQSPYSAVINLAARAGVRPSVENPWVYFQTNCHGTLNLLELCRQFGVKKFVLASTSSLYGAHNSVPYREDSDTNRPLSPYAASKKGAEAICYTYHHLHGLDITVFRYFTVFGPAGRPDMSVFRFVRHIAEGEPIVVFGDGLQQRDFTYVDDIARGTVLGLRPLGYEVINLGGDRPVRLATVIDGIAELVGRKPVIGHRPAHPADVPATWADITKAGQLLHWSPQVKLEEGLRRSVAWYRENREMAVSLELGE
jgi:nucleoside-diphosphate-sugar epimerase